MARISCPASFWLTIWMVFVLLAASLSVFGIMYSANRLQLDAYADVISLQLSQGVRHAVDQIVYELKEAASAVADVEPLLQNCSMPSSAYPPQNLIRLFNALSSPSRPLGSLGIIQHASNTSNGKVSWQVASGFGCADYMYAYADPANYPNFTGYCYHASNASLVDNSPDYLGNDWGLKKEEYELLVNPRTQSEAFLPVFPLLGSFTLTYEKTVKCASQTVPYAAAFAEQSLSQLDVALETLTASDNSLAFIIERSTGALVSASAPNLTQIVMYTPDGTSTIDRVFFKNSSSYQIYQVLESMDGDSTDLSSLTSSRSWNNNRFWVSAVPYKNDAGLDWVLIVAVPQGSFFQTLANASAFSIGLSITMIVLGVALTFLGVHFLISRPLNRLQRHVREGMSDETKAMLDDSSPIVELDDMLHAVKGYANMKPKSAS